jgi:hypothetical protein
MASLAAPHPSVKLLKEASYHWLYVRLPLEPPTEEEKKKKIVTAMRAY